VQVECGVESATSVGKREHLHSNSLSKAILSELDPDRAEAILGRRGMPAKTEGMITNRDELFDELGRVRDTGYAIDKEENVHGVRCVGTPIK